MNTAQNNWLTLLTPSARQPKKYRRKSNAEANAEETPDTKQPESKAKTKKQKIIECLQSGTKNNEISTKIGVHISYIAQIKRELGLQRKPVYGAAMKLLSEGKNPEQIAIETGARIEYIKFLRRKSKK